MYSSFFKRIIDILGSIMVLIVFSPIMIITGFLIWLQDFGPMLFKQDRVGRNGVIFKFYKFRSMPIGTPNVQSHETKKLKITPIGKFIRRTNLDELPQLFNVLIGDMSLIGPRPPIPSQINLVDLRKQNGALACRPGLTGLAQVNSYDHMPETEKANWDGLYANGLNFSMDVKIVLKTFLYLTKKPPTY